MKRSLLFIFCLLSGFSLLRAQVTSISVEPFYTDNGTITGYPAGHTTYRIYANTTSATDRVVTIFGDDDSPLVLNVTGSGVWNHPAGGVVGNAANCALYNVLPAVEYDSYLTVDYTCNSGSTNTIYSIEDAAQPWLSQVWNTIPHGAGSTLLNTSFGGAWFALTTDNNNVAGADLKVLIAQITTDGDICGIFNLQVFPDYQGTGSPYIEQLSLQFGTVDCGLPGCTDNTALNFNPAAGLNNGLCLYECGISISSDVEAPTCATSTDGSIEFEGAGGQDLIEYSFNGEVVGLSAPSFENLANGVYTIEIHDTRFDNELMNPGGIYGNCTVTEEITFNTTPLQLSGNTVTNVTCSGLNDGCITVSTFGGGTGIVSYALMNSNNTPVVGGDNEPVVTVEPSYCGLAPGTYYFMASDENGCTLQGNNFTVTSPAPLNLIEGSELAASCFNSSDATQVITWSGGTGDVDFSLENDGTYDIEGNLSNVVLTSLAPGSYTIYGSDTNGCEAELTFTVSGGPAIIINATVDQPSCNGDTDGSISVTATGGTGTLTYSSNGVDYSATSSWGDLASGVYMVYVKDNNNCVASEEISVEDPAELTATAEATNVSCFGSENATISISANGGTEPYAFSIDGGDSYIPSPLFTDLEAGDYMVMVADQNGCSFTLETAISITEPAAIEATATATDITCNGDGDGSIAVEVSGGTEPFTYSTGGAFGSANPIADLDGGTYDVTVLDANGCEFLIEGVEITEPEALVISNLTPDPIDETPGGNSVYEVTGGNQPYSYSWTNAGGTEVSDTENLPSYTSAADAGTYTLNVTDENGCTVTSSITITGVNDVHSAYSITITPNPTTGLFRMNMAGLSGAKMSYDIIDAQGRVFSAVEMGNVAGSRTESIDISNAAAGIYYIMIRVGDSVNSVKLIKQ